MLSIDTTAPTSSSSLGGLSVGRNARLTLTGIGLTSQLILGDVQGEFITGAAAQFVSMMVRVLFKMNSQHVETLLLVQVLPLFQMVCILKLIM